MNRIGVCSVLVTLLMTTVKAEGGVSFWMSQFTMTCPGYGEWYKGNTMIDVTAPKQEKLTGKYEDKSKGHYHCKYDSQGTTEQYHFYVRGKVCDSCFELDGTIVCAFLFADLLLTGGVILLVYVKAKKKEPAPTNVKPAPHAGRGRGGPPVPSPDYEALNPHTRNADPYSTVNRMG